MCNWSSICLALLITGQYLSAQGTIFVPLDSPAYSALTRLAALGFIDDQAAGMRPWSRRECVRQLLEAENALRRRPHSSAAREGMQIVEILRGEFAADLSAERPALRLDSIYVRSLSIAGTPQADGYNFGQTVIDDFGRPFGEGANTVAGLSVSGASGRFSFYARGEFQHGAPYSSPAGSLVAANSQIEPVLTAAPNGVNRFEPLEVYGGIALGKWSLTVGKQALWWGPGESGPLSFGDNAAPFLMFRLTTAEPVALPGVLRRLGLFRMDLAGGELAGHQSPPRPLLNAQKLSWNISRSLELGFARWSLFGGAGVRGFTAGAVLRNLFQNGASFGSAIDPGDRKSGFDFRWRPAGWVTLYADLYADDEPSPLTSPRRSALSPGIYVARLPGLPHWDLRAEAPITRSLGADRGGEFFYWNNVYRDANTNGGQLLGTWAGRDGRGLFLESAYWRSNRSQFRFTYRQNRVGSAFLSGGGSQTDASIRGDFRLKRGWKLTATGQFERFLFPSIGPARRNFSTSVDILYEPGR